MADAARRNAPAARVAIIGGGWSGCAAAVTLAGAGIPVTLFEQAKTLGGRARRVTLDGVAVDNGQHLLVGAYRETLGLLARVHGPDRAAALFHRLPLTLRPFGATPSNRIGLSAWSAPAPLHAIGALLTARGLRWNERRAVVAGFVRLARTGFRRPAGETVAQCFADTPHRAFTAVWEPLCLAALNTAPERASAQMFAHVLRATFTGTARHSNFLVPAADLSACFPDAAQRYIENRDGIVRRGATVRSIAPDDSGVAVDTGGETERFAAAIVAVGPHHLAAAIGTTTARDEAWRAPLAQVGRFDYESITTIYLGFAGRVPFPVPLMRLDDAPGQWLFDRTAALGGRGQHGAQTLAAVVISASGPHDALDHGTLGAKIVAQLRRLEPGLPPVAWSRVIAERRATYACTPDLARPSPGRVASHVYLAGDYTDPEFPATLEAACRSGIAAAGALIAARGLPSG